MDGNLFILRAFFEAPVTDRRLRSYAVGGCWDRARQVGVD